MNPEYKTSDSNDSASRAQVAINRAQGGTAPIHVEIPDSELVQVALTQATLALVEETRTATLMAYLATLDPDDRHEGPEVLALVRRRLGLNSTARPAAPGGPTAPRS